MKVMSKIMLSLATLASVGAMAVPASAATAWSRHHPRQHQVLAREHYQLARIRHERREGELTRGQAHALRVSDHAIAMQDHADARANGGHIRRAEQRRLNAEENAQSRAIGR
jgi:hypothetical protein